MCDGARSDWNRVTVNGITLSDALTCWERGQNEHNGLFRLRPGTVRHNADIYLLTGLLTCLKFRNFKHVTSSSGDVAKLDCDRLENTETELVTRPNKLPIAVSRVVVA